MIIKSCLAKQLGNPSGIFGRFLMKLLNRENAEMNDLALEKLNLQPEDYVLEIGFGGGYLMDKIAATQIPSCIVGIDPSIDSLQVGKKKFNQQIAQGYIELKQASAESLPCGDHEVPRLRRDRYFNKVCTVNTIYFWSDAKSVLQECYRVLKQGGKLVICYNSKAFLEQTELIKYGFTAYEVEDVELLMQDSGFTEIATTSAHSAGNGLFHCTSGMVG